MEPKQKTITNKNKPNFAYVSLHVLDLNLACYKKKKINSKWIYDLNVKYKTTTLQKKKQDKTLRMQGQRQQVLRLDTKSTIHKRKVDNWISSKLKNCAWQKSL